VCVPFISTKSQPAGGTCHGPSQLQLLGCGQSLRPGLAPNHPWSPTTCVFITAGPIIWLCAGGGRGTVKDMCYEVRRAETYVD